MQRAYILSRPAREAVSNRKRGRSATDVTIDTSRGGAVIHGHFISKAKLIDMLKQL